MNARACRVCGCTPGSRPGADDACLVDGVPCHWPDARDNLCSACAAARPHAVATCQAPYCTFVLRADTSLMMDEAIVCHWQNVVAVAREPS